MYSQLLLLLVESRSAPIIPLFPGIEYIPRIMHVFCTVLFRCSMVPNYYISSHDYFYGTGAIHNANELTLKNERKNQMYPQGIIMKMVTSNKDCGI